VTAKARRANGDVDRPLLPSEQARLVEDATRLALGCPVRCLGYWTRSSRGDEMGVLRGLGRAVGGLLAGIFGLLRGVLQGVGSLLRRLF
jgi:hypothetical protein